MRPLLWLLLRLLWLCAVLCAGFCFGAAPPRVGFAIWLATCRSQEPSCLRGAAEAASLAGQNEEAVSSVPMTTKVTAANVGTVHAT